MWAKRSRWWTMIGCNVHGMRRWLAGTKCHHTAGFRECKKTRVETREFSNDRKKMRREFVIVLRANLYLINVLWCAHVSGFSYADRVYVVNRKVCTAHAMWIKKAEIAYFKWNNKTRGAKLTSTTYFFCCCRYYCCCSWCSASFCILLHFFSNIFPLPYSYTLFFSRFGIILPSIVYLMWVHCIFLPSTAM